MSSIAYITDSKLLELHRLNNNKTMNFWRLSDKNNFKDFNKGDILFFLSKNKEYIKDDEKGIVGYGVFDETYSYSPKQMWERFGNENGYNSYDIFAQAILKASRDKKLPKKISSLYLKDVVYFQSPIYLSECGISISKNMESFLYIKPDEIVIKLLDYAKDAIDMWSNSEDIDKKIEEQKLYTAVSLAHKDIGDYSLGNIKQSCVTKKLDSLIETSNNLSYIGNSKQELIHIKNDEVLIIFYYQKEIDIRLLIGQAELYKTHIMKYYQKPFKLYFKTSLNDIEIENIINHK